MELETYRNRNTPTETETPGRHGTRNIQKQKYTNRNRNTRQTWN